MVSSGSVVGTGSCIVAFHCLYEVGPIIISLVDAVRTKPWLFGHGTPVWTPAKMSFVSASVGVGTMNSLVVLPCLAFSIVSRPASYRLSDMQRSIVTKLVEDYSSDGYDGRCRLLNDGSRA